MRSSMLKLILGDKSDSNSDYKLRVHIIILKTSTKNTIEKIKMVYQK